MSGSVSRRSNWTVPLGAMAGPSISSVSGDQTWRKSDDGCGSPAMNRCSARTTA